MKRTLEEYYKRIVKRRLANKFVYVNIGKIPQINKIELRITLTGLDSFENRRVSDAIALLEGICGRKAIVGKEVEEYVGGTKKYRITVFVTLRKSKMYAFVDYIIKIVVPLSRKRFSYFGGNVNEKGQGILILRDLSVLYEMRSSLIEVKDVLEIRFGTNATKREEGINLLLSMGILIKK